MSTEDKTKHRVYIRRESGVEIKYFTEAWLAYAVWTGLPDGVRAAFRDAGDETPVYSWDYV